MEYESGIFTRALSEAHDLIVKAWTKIGPFHGKSKHYDFRYVNTWPRPYQQPHPPIWIPSQGSRETIVWAAAAERKYNYLQTYSPISSVQKFLNLYREEANKAGYTATSDQLGWMAPVYVGKTDDSARAEAKPHIEAFSNKFLRMKAEMVRPPGYLSLSSATAVMEANGGRSAEHTIDSLIASGQLICGSAAAVRSSWHSTKRTSVLAISSRSCSLARCHITLRWRASSGLPGTSSQRCAPRKNWQRHELTTTEV
jgi:alkanesulfonate monooxygenase SsuD/methylene tetrahydromethanopterin reductase-like flavin-dependent oxidoreductase (luciferase family)